MTTGLGAWHRIFAAVVAVLCITGSLAGAASADAAPGGISTATFNEAGSGAEPASEAATSSSLLLNGRALAPSNAPLAVKKVIQAANRIRSKPYIWGGGHGRWWDRGYDCSGSVSYALHGAGLLATPMVSGSFASWGAPGPGQWITIYANATHVYAEIAGLRWDTVGDTTGTGPRWHPEMVPNRGFVVRHPIGY